MLKRPRSFEGLEAELGSHSIGLFYAHATIVLITPPFPVIIPAWPVPVPPVSVPFAIPIPVAIPIPIPVSPVPATPTSHYVPSGFVNLRGNKAFVILKLLALIS